jgi:hypothetical protein
LKSRRHSTREFSVITAIVQFQLPATVDAAKAAELFHGSAPKYRALPGLLRKYYIYDKDTHTGGGCYLWESRAAAEKFYDAEWRQFITDRYGSAPKLSYFETPVIVDNVTGQTERHA